MCRTSFRPLLRIRFALFLSLTVLAVCALVCAQVSTTGKITGTVTDASGAAVVGATVEVKSTALMQSRSAQTAADGSFLFDLLPPGAYQVLVSAKGFQSLQQTGVQISAGFTATVNPR